MSDFQRIYKTSNTQELVDGNGDAIGTADNRLEVESRDTDTYNIFNGILKELKKINMHLSLQNDVVIDSEEII
jgi:hypothetical protein